MSSTVRSVYYSKFAMLYEEKIDTLYEFIQCIYDITIWRKYLRDIPYGPPGHIKITFNEMQILYSYKKAIIAIHGKQIQCGLEMDMIGINTIDTRRYWYPIKDMKKRLSEAMCDIGHPELSYHEYKKTLTKKRTFIK